MMEDNTAKPTLVGNHCLEYDQIDRRAFLRGGLGLLASGAIFGNALIALPTWMPRISLAAPYIGPRGDTLVCVFLRGGADGLNVIVPHGDEIYYDARPTLAISRPDETSAEFRSLDLDGFFGLHPSLEPLSAIYRAGAAAFVHATGSPDETRSHFEAMALMERGATTGGDYSGWLARHLMTLDTGNQSALRAVGIGDMLPASLTGAVSATAIQSIADYHLQGRDARLADMQAMLRELYNQQKDILTASANQTFDSIAVLGQIDVEGYRPAGRACPEQDFGRALQIAAQLIKADVGVEVACIDLDGWDTHAAQGAGEGLMANRLEILGQGLAAFYEDLQAEMDNITVVVMSEFGRRVKENAARGTDHGHGNMMMVIGNGINGGKVYADWPGLAAEQRVGPGDLAITTDYRDVLAEILVKRLSTPDLGMIFPGYSATDLGLAVPRV